MLINFDGTHNSSRPDEVVQRCFQFIEESLSNHSRPVTPVIPDNSNLNNMVELEEMGKRFLNGDIPAAGRPKYHVNRIKSSMKNKT
jgi:hypothetical protein